MNAHLVIGTLYIGACRSRTKIAINEMLRAESADAAKAAADAVSTGDGGVVVGS